MSSHFTSQWVALFGALASTITLSACGGGDSSEASNDLTSASAHSVNQVIAVAALPPNDSASQPTESTADTITPRLVEPEPEPEPIAEPDSLDAGSLASPDQDSEPAAPPPPEVFTTPRVAATRLSGPGSTLAEQRNLARFGFVVTGLSGSTEQMQSVVDTMRKTNPALKLANYTNLVEANHNPVSGSNQHEPSLAVIARDWWTYTASGNHVVWTTAYDTSVVNTTRWAPPDGQGRRYPQWLADHQAGRLGRLAGLDYVYSDNVWHTPRPRNGSADWKRNGTDQLNSSPEIQAAHRQGTADYWTRLRARMPGKMIIGNADNDLSHPEFKGKLNGSFLECGLGKSWSLETRGWQLMMGQYRAMLANTRAPKDVVLQACGTNGLDLNALRYGLASALLEDGWFAYNVTGQNDPFWADEYSAPLGTAAEAPPTSATPSGIWMRKYTNGIVLVNPTATTASVSIGAGYRHLIGTQDPITNNGRPVEMVTLPPKNGALLVKQPAAQP